MAEEQFQVNVTTKMFPEGRVGERLLTVRANSVEEAEQLHKHLVASLPNWEEAPAEGAEEAAPAKKPTPIKPKAPPANAPETCEDCGGTDFWDNREGKKNPRSPDYKCKDCGKGYWLTPYKKDD